VIGFVLSFLSWAFAGSEVSLKEWLREPEIFESPRMEDLFVEDVERICERAQDMDSESEYEEAEMRLRELVEQESPHAAFRLAQMLQRRPDYSIRAYLELLSFAADAGHGEAEFWYAKAYQDGLGVRRNPLIAASRFRKAWELGFERGKTRLAELYWVGDGVRQNMRYAFRLFEEAAAKGDLDAQFALGEIYLEQGFDALKGYPMEEDSLRACLREKTDEPLRVALDWYTAAAEQDHPTALIRKGELLFLGFLEGEPDYAQALGAWSRAALMGEEEAKGIMRYFQSKDDAWPSAFYVHPTLGALWPTEVPRERWQYLIGVALAKDRKHFQNIRRALVYLRLSAKGGYTLAETAVKNVSKHLNLTMDSEIREKGRSSY
jgi:TPR repeat protein